MDLVPFMNPMSEAATVLSIALAGAVGFARLWWHRPVTIRFLRGTGPRFKSSFEFYKASFPPHETDEKPKVRRWLTEYRALRKRNDNSLAEYWVSSYRKGEACALFYGSLYPALGMMFVSYFAIDRDLKGLIRERVRNELGMCVRKSIAHDGHRCDAIVAEVEHPDLAPDKKSRRKRRGRIERLVDLAADAGIALVLLRDAPYVQPRLDLDDHTKREETMLLLYGQLGGPVPREVPRAQAASILTFVYEHVYADCYMDEAAKDASWRKYVAALCRDATSKLPPAIRCARAF